MCGIDTDWVGTAPVRAWVEWRWLDNASGAVYGDGTDTTDIDFDSSPLLRVDGMGAGEDHRTFRRYVLSSWHSVSCW